MFQLTGLLHLMESESKRMERFKNHFLFTKSNALKVGVERECFVTDISGNIKPLSPSILSVLADRSKFGYELSACQLEDRIGPVALEGLRVSIYANDMILKWAEAMMRFRRSFLEVAPGDIPLDVYPDPTGRYQRITKNMPQQILSAACRVTGTHIHIGMPDHQTALRAYNGVITNVDELCRLGDGSGGQRLEMYKIMAPDFMPPSYNSWLDFYQEAKKRGFESDPRKCWHLIRISVHGTIEFRMFGATLDLDKIVGWAKTCHVLCEKAMR
jgi:hypothetical protein